MARTAANFAQQRARPSAIQAALSAAEGMGPTTIPVETRSRHLGNAPERNAGPRGERDWGENLGRFSGRYDLFGNPVGTLMNVPLGGYVRAGAANLGMDPRHALWAERIAAAGITGVGAGTFMAAVAALNDNTQTPGTIPVE